MEADELIKSLEESGITLLDNQAIMDSMAGGYESASVFGSIPGQESIIAGDFTAAMPDATVPDQTLETSAPHMDFDNSLGLS